MSIISLEESKYFQEEVYKKSKALKLTCGKYVCGEKILIVSEVLLNTSCRYAYTIFNSEGVVVYDSEKDYCEIVYGRYSIITESLNRLRILQTLSWEIYDEI